MRKFFEDCGEMGSVVLMKDDKGQSKGFGFVCFKTGDSAAKAVKKH